MRRWCVSLLLAGCCIVTSALAQPRQPQTVGVIPAFNPEKMAATFEPLLDVLSAQLGITLHLETAPDLREFARRTNEERRYDFLLTAPHLYLLAEKHAGYQAVAKVGGGDFRALVVARAEGPVSELAALRGRQVAVLEPFALVTVLGRLKLTAAGLNPAQDLTLVETPDMDAALQAVLRGRTDAAVVAGPFFRERLHAEIRAQFRVIAESDPVPHMPVAVAPWIDKAWAEKLVAALLELPNSREGAMVLKRLGWPGFSRTSAQEYGVLQPFLAIPEQ